ncbi:MAG: glycosyltransferase [Bacteroidales bacterium]|jgi:glycosyltransferase involved in cell wall biosynthesis|nr:glycosyltransferase [Bacteroidales bacterium]
MKIISIAIPTFNRAEHLRENLENILPQIYDKQEEIELLINDNASTDNTSEIVMNIKDGYNFPILYTKHPNNIGICENFNDVVDKTQGKYVFLMGDDDLLSPNFFDIILNILSQNEDFGIIHFNRLSGDSFCSNNRLHDNIYDGMQNIYDAPNFIKRIVSSPNFMSSMIFLKECWEQGATKIKDNYYGYDFFARICWGALDKKCLYYYMPLVIMRNPPIRTWSKMWSLYCLVGMSNIFFDLDQKISGIYDIWQNRMRHSKYYDFWEILSGVIIDRKFYRTKRKEINKHLKSVFEKCLLWIFLYLKPVELIKVLYLLCLKIFRLISRK